jgi:hypothetical protein
MKANIITLILSRDLNKLLLKLQTPQRSNDYTDTCNLPEELIPRIIKDYYLLKKDSLALTPEVKKLIEEVNNTLIEKHEPEEVIIKTLKKWLTK